MANDKIDINALGQALDTTWGRSSTPRTASYSVKITQRGPDRLHVSYAAVVNFGSEREMLEMKRRYETEAESVIANVLKRLRSTYKDLTGSTLSTKIVGDPDDSVEAIGLSAHNSRRIAYYRRRVEVEVA